MKLYVAMDIGCLEYGEESACLGIFKDREKAQAALDAAEAKQEKDWSGEHDFEAFEVDWPVDDRTYDDSPPEVEP